MPRLNYIPGVGHHSDAPIYREGWRSIKLKLYAMPAVGVYAARERFGVKSRALATITPESMDGRPWNVNFLNAACRRPKISAEMPKTRSAWDATAIVLKSTPTSPRKPKAHDESAEPTGLPPVAHAITEKAQTYVLASPTPISSRKSQARETEESRLRLDHMLLLVDIATMLIAESTSLNRPIKNFQPSSPCQATGEVQRHYRHNDRGRLVPFPPIIADYVPEYGITS